jgi:hypothetical protein
MSRGKHEFVMCFKQKNDLVKCISAIFYNVTAICCSPFPWSYPQIIRAKDDLSTS